MIPSPAKRRKTSETSAVAVDASQADQAPRDNTNRARSPSRPSFQSPTRASLARSHPEVLARTASRIPTRIPQRPNSNVSTNGQQEQADARVFGLRDRKALRPSLTSTASPADGPRLSGGFPVLSPRRRSSGIQAFAAPPRRVSRRIGPSDIVFGTPKTSQNTATEPDVTTPEGQLALELDVATGETDPSRDIDAPSLHDGFDEPDLPPTPTQLGLEKPPGRPKGLLSSSPSRRHEKRRRRHTGEVLEPSPLKQRSVEYGGDESRDNLLSVEILMDRRHVSEKVLKKQKLIKDLSAELQQFKDEIAQLENWTEKLNQSSVDAEHDAQDLNRLISLLTTEDPTHKHSSKSQPGPPPLSSLISALLPFSIKEPRKTTRETSPFPTNPFALREIAQSTPYLTVFAPLTLTSHLSKLSTSDSGSLSETHNIILAPPPPFPRNLYNVSVIYKTQPETQSLVSVSVSSDLSSQKANIPEVLQQWVDSRLSNPLLRLDITGLCWGINRYWEAAISRAQVWVKIERRFSKLIEGCTNAFNSDDDIRITDWENTNTTLTASDLRLLLPHLERSTMIFTSKGKGAKLLLTCNLILDQWTSEPQLRPEISISTSSGTAAGSIRKIEHEAKKLFRALLHEGTRTKPGGVGATTDTVMRAAEGVLSALFGVDIKSLPNGKERSK